MSQKFFQVIEVLLNENPDNELGESSSFDSVFQAYIEFVVYDASTLWNCTTSPGKNSLKLQQA